MNMLGFIFACTDLSLFIILLVSLDGSDQQVLNEHSCFYWLKLLNLLFKIIVEISILSTSIKYLSLYIFNFKIEI